MSDLYRSALSARISKLPMHPPGHEEDEDEEAEAADSLGSLPPPISGIGPTTMYVLHIRVHPDTTHSMEARPGTRAHAAEQRRRGPNPELAPLSASEYFAQATQVDVQASGIDVRAYYTAPRVSVDGDAGTVMVCHHGAGHSALTFALMAKEITELSSGDCGVLALDCRGHGASETLGVPSMCLIGVAGYVGKTITAVPRPGPKGGEEDFSIETLTDDFVNTLKVVYPDPSTAPSLLVRYRVLIGAHSPFDAELAIACWPLSRRFRDSARMPTTPRV